MTLTLVPDGPGTTVVLNDSQRGAPTCARGTGALSGRFASGPTTFAALALNPASARVIAGEADDAFEASVCLDDLYSMDNPPVLICRVTDGLDTQAHTHLWDRKPSRSFLHLSSMADRDVLATVKAHNGGRWGGRKRVLVGEVTLPTDITEGTLDTGLTMLEDVWAGALLYLEGDTAGPYEVVSNDTTGILTIKGSFADDVLAADGMGAIDGQWRLDLDHDKELAVVVGRDSVAGSRFSLEVARKFKTGGAWEMVGKYDHLGLHTSDEKPWLQTILQGEEDANRFQVAVECSFTGQTTEAKLPANYCEMSETVTDNTLTFQWYRWTAPATNTGNPYVNSVEPIDDEQVVPHVITLTFTAPTTADVSITWPDGTTQVLPDALTLGTPFAPDHPQLCEILVEAGATPAAANDTLTIRVNALPLDLYRREAYLYPVAVTDDGNPSIRLRIVSNTYNSVSVRSDIDLADYSGEAWSSPTLTSTVDLTAVTWVVAETLILTVEGIEEVTFTGAGEVGTAAIVAALTSADVDGYFAFSASADGKYLIIRLAKGRGPDSTITVGAGTANTHLGFTPAAVAVGSGGHPARIEARWPMWGGYDGVEPDDSRYALAFDLTDHRFRRHLTKALGLVRLATPGVYAEAVQDSAIALVESLGWMYVAEFDPTLYAADSPGEAAVEDVIGNAAESDFVERYFPSDIRAFNVAGTKVVERSASGLIIGLRSKLANVGVDGEKGLHIAAANNNEQGRLSPRAKGLPSDIGRWIPPIKLLNDHGIVPILWEGSDVFLYGNRLYSKGRTENGDRYTITERAVFYHVARDLFNGTRPWIFKSISTRRLSEVLSGLRDLMRPYWRDGWFSDHAGTGFEDQVSVVVPPELNTTAELLQGNVYATVEFRPRPSIENIKITITPTSLTSES